MSRTAYRIRANERSEQPTQQICFMASGRPADPDAADCREEVWHSAVACCWRWEGGEVSRHRVEEFDEPADWWAWLAAQLHSRRRTWVWSVDAHRHFCLSLGWLQVVQKRLSVKWLLDRDPPWVLRGSLAGKLLTWVDIQNWFTQERDAAGRIGMTFEGLYELVRRLLAWHKDADLGCLGWTAADCALRAYRHRFGPRMEFAGRQVVTTGKKPSKPRPCVWPQPHGYDYVRQLERSAYYGGMFTCHRLGKVAGPVYVLDLNSHYASVMQGNYYPCKYVNSAGRVGLDAARNLCEKYATVATVRLCAPDHPYPVRRNGRVGTAVGEFWTALPGPELRHGLDNGHVQAIGEIHWYERRDLFTPFVDALWSLRRQALQDEDTTIAGLCKFMMVSLSGKWAQRGKPWVNSRRFKPVQPWGQRFCHDAATNKNYILRYMGNLVQEQGSLIEPVHSFPLISAYVTSFARLSMQRWIDLAGWSNVLYNPVDCLHVNKSGFDNLLQSDAVAQHTLGRFKVEKICQAVEYIAPGAWVGDGVLSAIGVPREAQRVGDKEWKYRRVEHCCEVFHHATPEGNRIMEETTEAGRRELWGREDAAGWVYPPLLTESAVLDPASLVREAIQ